MHSEGGPTTTPASPPPALAYWVPADARTVVRAAARRTLDTPDAPPALRGAVLELDAAAVRSRWFDHPAAGSFRRIAGHAPDAVTLRLSDAEHAALVACDPAVVEPLLDDDTRPARPSPPSPVSPGPIELPTAPAGPVVVLDYDGINLRWAVAEYDGAAVSVGQPSPAAGIWTRACENTRHEPVEVEVQDAARRLVAKSHPALSTLVLARPDFRPVSGEAVLVRLPDIVVIASAAVAARVITYVAPTPVLSLTADALPAEPTPASTAS